MKKSIFTNQTFYYLLVIYVGMLLSYNIYLIVIKSFLWSIFPIVIQGTLLYVILIKSEYARQAIRVWAIVFVIIAPSLILSGQLLGGAAGGFEKVNSSIIIYQTLILISGILVLVFTNRTVFVRLPNNEPGKSFR